MNKSSFSSLIIDDDPLICDLIEHFCQKSDRVSYCLSVGTGKDGLQLLATETFDLIFLDFNLPDMTAREFLELNTAHSKIIMITSEKEFALESYNYPKIIDYLVKPVGYDRFCKALSKLITPKLVQPVQSKKDLIIKDGQSMVKIKISDIDYIKAEGNYVSIQSGKNKYMTIMSLSKMLDTLPERFMKSHRSYIVNLSKVEEMTSEELRIGQKWIPISTGQRQGVAEKWAAL